MKLTYLFILAGAFFVARLSAQQLQVEAGHATVPKPLDWTDSQWWNVMRSREEGISLGRSEFVMRGPVVDLLRPRRPDVERRSLRQRFFGMPFVSPFSPRESGRPVQRVDYFAWGDRNTAWSALADRPIPGPQSALMTVSR
jgi:hypothetical protein